MDSKTKNLIEELSKNSFDNKLKVSEMGRAIWIEAKPEYLPILCTTCVELNLVFDSAFTYPYTKSKEWVAAYLFRAPGLDKIAVIWAHSSVFYSASGLIPAALWDERKILEISGVNFIGLSDSRPIVIHPESMEFTKSHAKRAKAAEYAFAKTGVDGEFQIPVGPVHAGIIEPGHFRFHVIGEKITKLEVRLSYLHKGIEALAEGEKPESIFPLIEQISGDESVSNSVAYAQAVEDASGITPDPWAESLRLILLEMERIYNHLADIGGISMDVGYYASSSQFLALREDMMRLNLEVSGNRFLRGMISIGGISKDISPAKLNEVKLYLSHFSKLLSDIEGLTMSSSTFLDRVFTTGRVFPQTAKELSLVGPAARASGISCDLRKHLPYGAYKDTRINEVLESNGDVLSRFMAKLDEIKESVRLINLEINKRQRRLSYAKAGGMALKVPIGRIGIGFCEGPRGASTFVVQFDKSGRIARLSVRTASFRNWRAIEKAVKSNIIADFPLINKSFNLSYSGSDL